MKEFLKEFWEFIIVRKKFFLLPIIVIMLILGGLILSTQGTVIAPFIYTFF